jgi:hypothetical protein
MWDMAKATTVSGVTGIAMLAVGLGLPKVIEGLPLWFNYGLVGVGVVLLLVTYVWHLLNGREAEGGQHTHGPGSHIFSGDVHNPVFHAGVPKFSAEQTIFTVPDFMGGNRRLDLGGIATLTLFPPWDEQSLTMKLDTVPMTHGGLKGEGFELSGIAVTVGEHQTFVFNVGQNRRHTISAGGKVFTVTLREIDQTPVEGVAKALRYKFSIAEV